MQMTMLNNTFQTLRYLFGNGPSTTARLSRRLVPVLAYFLLVPRNTKPNLEAGLVLVFLTCQGSGCPRGRFQISKTCPPRNPRHVPLDTQKVSRCLDWYYVALLFAAACALRPSVTALLKATASSLCSGSTRNPSKKTCAASSQRPISANAVPSRYHACGSPESPPHHWFPCSKQDAQNVKPRRLFYSKITR